MNRRYWICSHNETSKVHTKVDNIALALSAAKTVVNTNKYASVIVWDSYWMENVRIYQKPIDKTENICYNRV